MSRIYKVLGLDDWEAAQLTGRFTGAEVDIKDGYIHFSTAAQAAETGRKYFSHRLDLILLEIEADDLGPALKWEPAREGALFPHLYAPLDCKLVRSVRSVALDADGAPKLADLPA